MTDVPRRSYPLVVPPPGGFENAVHRGRRIRRRRAGGSTGAALMLAGALAWSTLSGPGSTTGLQMTNDKIPHADTIEAPGEESPTPEATVSPTDTTTSSPHPGSGDNPYTRPSNFPDPVLSVPPAHQPPGGTTRAFAKRGAIEEMDETTGVDTACLERAVDPWCAIADVDPPAETNGLGYRLSYTLCRSVNDGQGVVAFDRTQEVEFVAIDTKDDADPKNDEAYWTYSRGQGLVVATAETPIEGGNCVEWYTYWNGYDDYGLNDADGGQYILRAVSTGKANDNIPLPADDFAFDLS